jgi:hypothetical protein
VIERVTVTIHLSSDRADVLRDLKRLGFDNDEVGMLIGAAGGDAGTPVRLTSAVSITASNARGTTVAARRAP